MNLVNKIKAGEQTGRYRCSTTELPELKLRAGFEPATTGLRGEVTASYTTGYSLLVLDIHNNHRGTSEKSLDVELLLCGAL